MALISQSNSGATFASLLAPFTGVNNGSARLLKAISAGELATLREGDVVYVESLRDYWKWLPTSVLTSDDITVSAPTVVGGGAGRFERLLGNASPDWKLQAAWFINSTAANQEGDGSALSPLQSDVELTRRWGLGDRARLSIGVTVTYTQAPTLPTNYCCELTNAASLTLIGTPTVTKAGTAITAVQVQVRTAGAELGWAITGVGLGAADVGKLVFITAGTAGNIGAYAAVLKDEGGGKIRVSPFGKFALTTTPFTQVTPVVGDTVEIRDNFALTVGTIDVRTATEILTSGTNVVTYFMAQALKLTGGTQFTGAIEGYRVAMMYSGCQYDGILLGGAFSQSAVGQHRLCGGHGGGAASNSVLVRGPASATFSQVGFTVAPLVSPGANMSLSVDCYFQNCGITNLRITSISSSGVAFFDRAVANGALIVAGGVFTQVGGIADWGTNNAGHGIVVTSTAAYSYATKPTINSGLGAGREAQIGGTDKLYAAVPYIEGANGASLVLTA